MSVPSIEAFRWWHVEPVMELERELFAPDCWSRELFWSELAQPDTRYYLVAGDGGRVVGYAGLAHAGPEAFIQTLGVARAAQRRGLGRQLLDELLDRADRAGVRRVSLEVRTDNDAAHHLYERAGFTAVAVRRNYYQPSGADADVMVLDRPGG